MGHHLKREELYDLVWSEPMKKLAERFAISDVGLAKACKRAAIPVPDRGYWAKRQAGKPTTQVYLSPRPPGMSEEIVIGEDRRPWEGWLTDDELLEPIPPPASFPEPIEVVRQRVVAMIGKVRVRKDLVDAHPQVARLLRDDDRRREKVKTATYVFSWDSPKFDSPFERRRLQILSALFFGVSRCGCRPAVHGAEGRRLTIFVGGQYVHFVLDRGKDSGKEDTLEVSIGISADTGGNARRTWRDTKESKIEAHLSEIAVELVVTGEVQYREHVVAAHRWRIERKAELEEKMRRHSAEEARRARERQAKLERDRVTRLLEEATALRQAAAIREYVDAVRVGNSQAQNPVEANELDRWAAWALAQADRIDPIKNRRFLARDDE